MLNDLASSGTDRRLKNNQFLPAKYSIIPFSFRREICHEICQVCGWCFLLDDPPLRTTRTKLYPLAQNKTLSARTSKAAATSTYGAADSELQQGRTPGGASQSPRGKYAIPYFPRCIIVVNKHWNSFRRAKAHDHDRNHHPHAAAASVGNQALLDHRQEY